MQRSNLETMTLKERCAWAARRMYLDAQALKRAKRELVASVRR